MLPVETPVFLSFLVMMGAFAVTPGPANVFMMATGLRHGAAGVPLAVAGLNAATLVWYGAAALGLVALVKAMPQLFQALAIVGGLYVGWLGLKALRGALAPAADTPGTPPAHPSETPPSTPAAPVREGGASLFVQGFTVQIANPKAVVFFSAALPPFLDPAGNLPAQFALYASATVLLDSLAMGGYGLLAALAAAWLVQPRVRRGLDAGVGVLLLLSAGLILARAVG
jgi:threonine/homoserine/homoserine lactone efflux protein